MPYQIHVFATREDLVARAGDIEASPIQYVDCDELDGRVQTYRSIVEIPDLGTNKTDSHMTGARYLVIRNGVKPVVRTIPQRKGGVRYSLDQRSNPQSIVFWPGGSHESDVLICGHVGTISEDRRSVELYESFCRGLLRTFVEIKGYHVGPEALGLLKAGGRLVTVSVRSPIESDLRAE